VIVNLYCGADGWGVGLRAVGYEGPYVGVDLDADACATARAGGHDVVRADVWRLVPSRVVGLVASPPCTTFSAAGAGAGRRAMGPLSSAIIDAFAGRNTMRERTAEVARIAKASRPYKTCGKPVYRVDADGERTVIGYRDRQPITRVERAEWGRRQAIVSMQVVAPARWIAAVRPGWVAMEQVPDVLPLWRVYVEELRRLGYRAWCGVLNSADFGVPQTRRRAILMATRVSDLRLPVASHCEGGSGPSLLGPGLVPWVSMAQALGTVVRCRDARRATTRYVAGQARWRSTTGRNAKAVGCLSPAATPPPTITGEAHRWTVRTGMNTMKHSRDAQDMVPYERSCDEPAPTVDGKVGGSWRIASKGQHIDPPQRWKMHTNRDQREDAATMGWVRERPATTVQGDPRVSPPGWRGNPADYADGNPTRSGDNAVRVTVQQAATLQGFPPDYPWQGTRTAQFRQVGNAIPPPLAAVVLAPLLALDLEAVGA
jgi:DNA (cytosine-5)-methyltransferase 1